MSDRILVVDDEAASREGLRRLLEAWGYDAETAADGESALEAMKDNPVAAVLTDLVMPGMSGIEVVKQVQESHSVPVIVLSGQGTIDQAVEAIKLGATDFLEKPVEPERLKLLLEKLSGTLELLEENRQLRATLRDRGTFGQMQGISPAMRSVFHAIEQVAPSKLSVLISGESGTGKELVASTLHERSPRRRRPFIALNCAAIPETLLESEIFGHERGAFTGALQRKIGCFEMADGGTLFLDEIAEMNENLQAKLLRVLQEQSFRRLGGRETVSADVRVVAATNRDPKQAIESGRLREDLYYRLNVFSIELPPLRERADDVLFLAERFIEDQSEDEPVKIEEDAKQALLRHHWPGNVRELKNVIHRALLLSAGNPIGVEHLPADVLKGQGIAETASKVPVGAGHAVESSSVSGAPGSAGASQEDSSPDAVTVPIGASMQEIEEKVLRETLEHTGGNKTQAAKLLGISLKTIHNKVKKYQL